MIWRTGNSSEECNSHHNVFFASTPTQLLIGEAYIFNRPGNHQKGIITAMIELLIQKLLWGLGQMVQRKGN